MSSSMPTVPSVTWIQRIGHGAGHIPLLDDDVAGPRRDDGLGLGNLVANRNEEPPGMSAHALILADRNLDQLVAAQPRALAPEADRGILFVRPLSTRDAFVDLPECGSLAAMRRRTSPFIA
jgi:hypothetical protein